MKEWFTVAELLAADLPDMPADASGYSRYIGLHGWRLQPEKARKRAGQKGGGYEYHLTLLPVPARQRLSLILALAADEERSEKDRRRKSRWNAFEALTADQKMVCEDRLKALRNAYELTSAGLGRTNAMKAAAHLAGVSMPTLYAWDKLIQGIDREDWLAALAPSVRSKTGAGQKIDEDAWDFLKSDYLRPEKPTFSACYRRMLKVAKRQKWLSIPSEDTCRRRFDREVPRAVQVLARSGKDKAKTLFPAQRRVRTHFHAMQAVNMDGHKIDVFISVPWSEKPIRMFLVCIQDLYSGKIVSWRLSDAETWEAVRLVIGDMVEVFGIPDDIYLDNGRAFASKWISGQSRTRFRFKVKEEDPQGLLVTLGIQPHWTTPYSGQSKPIERAFRDLADNIAKHPYCAGAYTGNRPDAKPENYMTRAIPLEGFRMHVAAQITDHNAQEDRRAAACAGRSFDETFTESLANPSTIVRWPTAAQKSLWLLASETLRTKKGSGEIHFQGNRYWSRDLNAISGAKVTIRFDPDKLHESVRVYDLDNRLICEAACIADTGFDNVDAARQHARTRRDYAKALQAQREAHTKLTAAQLADIIYRGEPTAPGKSKPSRPAVTRLATRGSTAPRVETDAISDDEFLASFSNAVARAADSASILEFPRSGNGPAPASAGRSHEPKRRSYGSRQKKGGSDPAR
ncbi:transposase domain-containing protein [Rhizobium halophytocola]|uniref:Transposase InsO family protein n=1 Tax=Rhizobium halophytocola TaxID=735519 RepID=A0ABS4E449_9HYPH|nr:transposase domain-containing protein [Rhizobium halophytocola]MBP1852714.1 transposase InsO family protein [Rhizobium halophytocola]